MSRSFIRETSYRAWGWSRLESLTQDVRYGVRSMFRSPALTLVALLSLALGIGANTAIFSFLDTIMLRSLPVKEPARLVLLGEGNEAGVTDRSGSTTLYSYPFYRQFQQNNAFFPYVASLFSLTGNIHATIDAPNPTQLIPSHTLSQPSVPPLC